MSTSPLQLDRYFFSRILLQASGNPDLAAVNNINAQIAVSKPELPAVGGGVVDIYVVTLRVRLTPIENNNPPYTGEFIAVGFFRIFPDFPKEKREKLIGVNGAAILYSAIREMVSNLTARGPFGMVTLVPMNFQSVGESDSQESAEDEKPSQSPGKRKVAAHSEKAS